MFFVGEMYYKGHGCKDLVAEPMHFFKDGNGNEYTQLAVSEAAAACMLNKFAESEIGTIVLTEDKLTQLINNPEMNIKLTSSSIAKHIPLFEEKLGQNQPLRVDLSAKNI